MSEADGKAPRYFLFLALELAGMLLVLWTGLPIYRHLMMFEQVATTSDHAIMWCAVLAIQFSYWHTLRHEPPFAFPQQVFFAHVLLFASRLSFVFASSLFALVAYRYSDAFELPPGKALLFIAVLFSVFCFSRNLEAIGSRMLKGPGTSAETRQNAG